MSHDTSEVDCVIVGAGVAGCAMAFYLKKVGLTALVVECKPPSASTFPLGHSLTPQLLASLRSLDLLEAFEQSSVTKHESPGVWISWTSEAVLFNDHYLSASSHGYHVNMDEFKQFLQSELVRRGLLLWQNTTLVSEDYDSASDSWKVQTQCNEQTSSVVCKYLIDATGRKAATCSKIIKPVAQKYDNLLAFCMLYTSDTGDQLHHSLIESVSDGWFYTCQLSPGFRVVIYFTDDNLPQARTAKKKEGFEQLLSETRHVSLLLTNNDYQASSQTVHTTLASSSAVSLTTLASLISKKVIPVGDALMAFDPLSSQGIQTAFKCAESLARSLTKKEDDVGLSDFVETISQLQDEYAAGKRYFYEQNLRFDTVFWNRRRESCASTQ
eukprot:TRINITY_DN3132_c0_g1_i1.p1 TRINITY_DN3132_c0_g1~~TRINITY_DN3132_c0_g1_i1.p1  ORF type:complete len:383 (-),score=48.33 TRINITY_DN3132_c0_g1_i1:239-1387(-)